MKDLKNILTRTTLIMNSSIVKMNQYISQFKYEYLLVLVLKVTAKILIEHVQIVHYIVHNPHTATIKFY